MNDSIHKIRQLLDELEAQTASDQENAANWHSLPATGTEMSVVIQEIVDDLHPLLTPYEIAFYWHLFRHSIARGGNPLVRVSRTGLRLVAKSTNSDVKDGKLSQHQF